MFRNFLPLFLVVTVALGLPNYPTASKPSSYSGTATDTSSGYASGGSYGGSQKRCRMEEETVYADKCESYNEQVCYTTHQEQCDDVHDQNCRAIVSGTQNRQCFNVTELICGLKEEIQYDVVQAVYTVQKCHKVTGK